MPAMKIGRRLTTRPLAGDDFQIVCIIDGAFRIVTLLCNIPVWVLLFSVRLSGTELTPDGQPFWCRSDEVDLWTMYVDPTSAELQQQVDSSFGGGDALDDDTKHQLRLMVIPFSVFLSVSLLYNILDMILSLAIWNAAAIGTPCEPRGRERALASMVWIKITFLNLLLCTVLCSGIYVTYSGRLYNYGCSSAHNEAVENYESSIWYGLFSAAMVVYAVELLMWPCFIMNQVGHYIALQGRQTSLFKILGRLGDEEGCCAQCIFCCIQCIRWLSCNRMGGGSIEAKQDLADAAIAFMDFMNAEVKFGIVISDIYVAFKLLDRKHREVKYKLSKQARLDKKQTRMCEMGECDNESNNNSGGNDDTSSPIETVNFSVNYADVLNRRMLSENNATDMYLLRQGAHYSQYARGIYTEYPRALIQAGLLDGGWNGLYSPWKPGDKHSLLSTFRLSEFGLPSSALVYANFKNNVAATPYCILLDEIERTLVIVIRGSVTLEDLVTDLQFSAIELNRVGEMVGFDGRGKYCHRGMLTNSKWIYNDIHRQKIVSGVLRDDKNNPYRDYNLVITGHSLGASCAAILAIMFKPTYPKLKCYAFCPPGCIVSMNLATECDDFITSFVVGNDVIPRMRGENIEMLRYEFLEILARVKVSKIAAFRDSRYPCRNKDLEVRNKRILYARNAVPKTEYYQKLVSFRESREQVFDQISPVERRLNIPGRVIHLIRFGDEANKRYLPYYKSRMFREIHLCVDSMKDHSIRDLSNLLPTVVSEYENSSTAVSNDDDDISVQSENSFGGDISEEPWFVTFSFPQGIFASLIPTTLAFGAVCFSVIGNNLCTLFERRVINTPSNNMTGQVAGVSYGLYFYGVQYFDDENEIRNTQCKPYPPSVENDGYVEAARAFSVAAVVIGFPIVLLLCLTSCMKMKDRTVRVMSTLLLFVAIFQVMIFLFLGSARCVDDPNPVDSSYTFVWAKCVAYRGSKNVIIAGVLWILVAITLGFSNRLSLVEARLRFASMSLSSEIFTK